jgi:hypothetical protein
MSLIDTSNFIVQNGVTYRKKIRFYTLALTRDAVAGDTFTGSMQIDPGSPFYLTSLHAADTADTSTNGNQVPWLVTAQDSEGGYLWADGIVERSCMFGDRILGYPLPSVMPIRQNTRIQWTVKNGPTAPAAGTAYLVLRGFSLVPV